jgi:hypothetical protein
MSWAVGVTVLISGLVKGSLWPSFLTLLYADLRIRAGELEPDGDDAPPMPVPEAGADGATGA